MQHTANSLLKIQEYSEFKLLMKELREVEILITGYQNELRHQIYNNELKYLYYISFIFSIYISWGVLIDQTNLTFYSYWIFNMRRIWNHFNDLIIIVSPSNRCIILFGDDLKRLIINKVYTTKLVRRDWKILMRSILRNFENWKNIRDNDEQSYSSNRWRNVISWRTNWVKQLSS